METQSNSELAIVPIKGRIVDESTLGMDLPEDELRAYIATDEPYDKAGGYAIQETFSRYVTHVEGDIDNIIGFPFKRFLKELP